MEVEVKVGQGGRSHRRGNMVGATTCDHWSLNKHTDRYIPAELKFVATGVRVKVLPVL